MKIEKNYPGGNIIVNEIIEENGKTIAKVEQDLSDTSRWWFYWSFKVSEACGEVVFDFGDNKVVCPRGAAISHDLINWTWSDKADIIDNMNFKYTFKENEIVYFSFCPMYQVKHFEMLYDEIKNDEYVGRSVLCKSEQGRDIPLLKLGKGEKNIVFTSRHHCCEATGTYSLEGTVRGILENHRELLDKYTFHIVPFIDIDGAENGDQGKGRPPHDHNRDYIDEPVYTSIRALMNYTKDMKIAAMIDFHSPWRWGGFDNIVHIHLSPNSDIQDCFIDELKSVSAKRPQPAIVYDDSEYKSEYGSGANQAGRDTSTEFFYFERNVTLSECIETPYSGNLEEGYTIDNIKNFGRDVATALKNTLEKFE